MSAILIVRRDRKEISRHELTGTTYDIGRSRQGDILLEDDEVSRKHCTLTVQDGAYVIADAGSRNGIAVNGALAQEPVTLKDGDEITVGPFDLTFHAEGAAGEPGDAEDDDASTRFVSQKELKKTLPGKQVVEGDTQDPVRVKLELLEGPLKGAVYQNWSGDLTIGRGLDNHVVLVDDAVSIYHARIYRVGDDFYVEDLGSSNGSFLRGVRCTKEKLRNKDSIRIGTTTMAFTRTDLRVQKKVRKLAIMASGVALLLVLLVSLLTPDDRAELTAQRGYAAYNEKNYENARALFEEALAIDKNNQAARDGINKLKSRDNRLRTLAEARTAMESGLYDKAQDLCDAIIKTYSASESRSARSLKEAIRVFQEAMIAYDAANWTDAVRILKQLVVDYPNLDEVKRRLTAAEAEYQAEQALIKAQDAASRGQIDISRGFIQMVPASSMYFIAAKELDSSLTWLGEVSDLLKSDRVADMKTVITALEGTGHPLEATGIDPVQLKDRVVQRLVEISTTKTEQAKLAMAKGDRRTAYQLFEDAIAANADNTEAAEGSQAIQKLVQQDCIALFKQAQREVSLGQRDKARAIYEDIIEKALPGDTFQRRAMQELGRTE